MILRANRMRLIGVMAVFLLSLGCSAKVFHEGEVVDNKSIVQAGRIIRNAELTATAVTKSFSKALDANLLSEKVVRFYASDVAPAAQVALRSARDAVIRAKERGDAGSADALQVALTELLEALLVLQEFAMKYNL